MFVVHELQLPLGFSGNHSPITHFPQIYNIFSKMFKSNNTIVQQANTVNMWLINKYFPANTRHVRKTEIRRIATTGHPPPSTQIVSRRHTITFALSLWKSKTIKKKWFKIEFYSSRAQTSAERAYIPLRRQKKSNKKSKNKSTESIKIAPIRIRCYGRCRTPQIECCELLLCTPARVVDTCK